MNNISNVSQPSLAFSLANTQLFQGFSPGEVETLIENLMAPIRRYAALSTVAYEEDECLWLGVILSGSVKAERLLPSGKSITLDNLPAGSSFGEALIFADQNFYPATIQAVEDTRIIYFSRQDVIDLCTRSELFLTNFTRQLSNRLLMLNKKVKSLSFSSIRQRLVNHLIEENRRQKTNHLKIPLSRQALSDLLGMPRPSLSRELALLQNEGYIIYDRHSIDLLNLDALEKCLL